MATTTSGNLALTKPAYGDAADIAAINGNMDTIDTNFTSLSNSLTKLDPNLNYLGSGSIGAYIYSQIAAGKLNGSFLAYGTVSDLPDGYNSVIEYVKVSGTNIVQLFGYRIGSDDLYKGTCSSSEANAVAWSKIALSSDIKNVSQTTLTLCTGLNALGTNYYDIINGVLHVHLAFEATAAVSANTTIASLPTTYTYNEVYNVCFLTSGGASRTFKITSAGAIVSTLAFSTNDRISLDLFTKAT